VVSVKPRRRIHLHHRAVLENLRRDIASLALYSHAVLAAVPGSAVKDPLNMVPSGPLRIVTFHLNQVGDLLFSLPGLASLRAGFPGAQITAVVRPSLTSLLRSSDLVDSTIERVRGGLLAKMRLIRQLRREKFHIAVSFSQAEECVLLSRFSGAAVRAGFSGGHFASVFTIQAEKVGPPSTVNNLRLVGALGCPVVQDTYVGLVKLNQDDLNDALELLRKAGVSLDRPLVVLGPGTSRRRTIKEWPSERFSAVAHHFATKKGAQVAILGAESDPQIHAAARAHVVDLSGRTTLRQAAAILERATMFVGVDSGLMHLAAAMATPCVAIFGPSDPNLTGPQGQGHAIVRLGLNCSPCYRKTCPFNRECLENLTTEAVIEAAEDIWGARVGGRQ